MAFREFRGKTTKGGSAESGPSAAKTETYIDEGCELVGELRFRGTVRIDGRVEGAIWAAGTVIVGEAATIEAGIHADAVEVYGTVQGDLQVKRKTILYENARVTGEIQTAGIVVEEGARFKGCIVIGAEESSAPEAEPAASRPSKAKAPASKDAKDAPEESIAA